MKFRNNGPDTQVRIKEGPRRYRWDCIKTGEIINLSEDVGLRYGFEKVTESEELEVNKELPKLTEGQIGNTKVETKQIDNYTADDLFFKELTKINGIGVKIAKDIVVWGTKEKLIEAISHNAELPFRDDVVRKLEEKYGRS